MPTDDLPTRARVVIVGGGVGGASIAFHLAEMGCTDVLVLERHELTSGSTFHSAGLVGQLRSSLPLTRMMMHSVDTYRRLESMAAETGRHTGWTEVGSLRLASTDARMEELRRQHGWAKTFGLPTELLSPAEAHGLFPLMTLQDVRGALYLPTDGHLDPTSLTNAFVGAARDMGVTVRTHVRVIGFQLNGDRVVGVHTDVGTVQCDAVIVACGMYSPDVAALAGVTVPIVPMAHQYLITRPVDGVTAAMPSMRDPDNLVYFRNQGGGLVMGGYERNPAHWSLDGIPTDFNHRLLDADWPRFEPLMEAAVRRVPAVASAQIVQLLNGPEGFTPDNEFILGESHVRGFHVAAGFCAHGIAGAGGVGRVMAEWVLHGEPSFDTWTMDIRRFGRHFRSRQFALARTAEVYSTYYDIHYPHEERHAGRPLRRSAAYAALASLGCEFGEKGMWERPNWFADNDAIGAYEHYRPKGWAGRHWHGAVAAEAVACRQSVALFDESSFAKLHVRGPGAASFLQWICANQIDQPVGSVVYTQMCNERGGIECDVTVTRLAADRFEIITGTAFGQHDLGWILKQRNALAEPDLVQIDDVTSAQTYLGLWGPAARMVLAPLTSSPLDNTAFPYLSAQTIMVGAVPVLARRVTYVGELGWELACPTEYGAALWDTLWESGRAHQMVAGGDRAIESLRLEKGYRAWSADITPEDTPLEAGLGFAVAMDKGAFVGRAALAAQLAGGGAARRLVCLVLDDPLAVCLGSEPVRLPGGEVLGRVTSGGAGHSTRTSIAFAYAPAALAVPDTRLEVELFGDWVGATVHRGPVWDPTGSRIRA